MGVRARNKNGYGGWRNSAPSKPYVPINPPPKPKNVKAYPSDGAVTFIWDKPVDLKDTAVTGYQAAYWKNPGACAWPAAVQWHNVNGSDGNTTYYIMSKLQNGVKYGVALRALNQHVPGPAAAGCRTPAAGVKPPPFVPPAPESLNMIRGDGTLTVTWHHSQTATGYQVNYSADGGKTWKVGAWWNATTSVILKGMDDDATYTVKVRGRNDRGDGPWTDAKTVAPLARLTADSITDTTATLTLDRYTGAWYYRADAAPDNTCRGPVSAGTTTKALTGLSVGTTYTYTAYSDSGCATELATATFTTLSPVTVSNLGQTASNNPPDAPINWPGGGSYRNNLANSFITGSNGGGYTLKSATVEFAATTGTPGALTVVILANDDANSFPIDDTTPVTTLNGSSPTTAGDYTFTCSVSCSLDKDETYWLVMYSASGNYANDLYNLAWTASENQTNTPSNAGWEIGNAAKKGLGGSLNVISWGDVSPADSFKFKVTAVPK